MTSDNAHFIIVIRKIMIVSYNALKPRDLVPTDVIRKISVDLVRMVVSTIFFVMILFGISESLEKLVFIFQLDRGWVIIVFLVIFCIWVI